MNMRLGKIFYLFILLMLIFPFTSATTEYVSGTSNSMTFKTTEYVTFDYTSTFYEWAYVPLALFGGVYCREGFPLPINCGVGSGCDCLSDPINILDTDETGRTISSQVKSKDVLLPYFSSISSITFRDRGRVYGQFIRSSTFQTKPLHEKTKTLIRNKGLSFYD